MMFQCWASIADGSPALNQQTRDVRSATDGTILGKRQVWWSNIESTVGERLALFGLGSGPYIPLQANFLCIFLIALNLKTYGALDARESNNTICEMSFFLNFHKDIRNAELRGCVSNSNFN